MNDPTLGTCHRRNPLGHAPLFFFDQVYANASNDPLTNVDPSRQRFFEEGQGSIQEERNAHVRFVVRPAKLGNHLRAEQPGARAAQL